MANTNEGPLSHHELFQSGELWLVEVYYLRGGDRWGKVEGLVLW